jgi:hypothetical protein
LRPESTRLRRPGGSLDINRAIPSERRKFHMTCQSFLHVTVFWGVLLFWPGHALAQDAGSCMRPCGQARGTCQNACMTSDDMSVRRICSEACQQAQINCVDSCVARYPGSGTKSSVKRPQSAPSSGSSGSCVQRCDQAGAGCSNSCISVGTGANCLNICQQHTNRCRNQCPPEIPNSTRRDAPVTGKPSNIVGRVPHRMAAPTASKSSPSANTQPGAASPGKICWQRPAETQHPAETFCTSNCSRTDYDEGRGLKCPGITDTNCKWLRNQKPTFSTPPFSLFNGLCYFDRRARTGREAPSAGVANSGTMPATPKPQSNPPRKTEKMCKKDYEQCSIFSNKIVECPLIYERCVRDSAPAKPSAMGRPAAREPDNAKDCLEPQDDRKKRCNSNDSYGVFLTNKCDKPIIARLCIDRKGDSPDCGLAHKESGSAILKFGEKGWRGVCSGTPGKYHYSACFGTNCSP